MRFEGIEIGIESKSGLAVSVYFPDLGEPHDDVAHLWVPLSQVTYMRRNNKVERDDAIEIADWWCRKNGLV